MKATSPEIVVAGHICLDIIPELNVAAAEAEHLFQPGRLTRIGPATVSLGGCVANTGIALHRLGANVRLVGKLGDDPLSSLLETTLAKYGPQLGKDMIIAARETTSYSIVVNPPGGDRTFWHCPGANDTFSADDIDRALLNDARLFHFGYPPLMFQVTADGGVALAEMLRAVQASGGLTSLDMAMPGTSEVAVDWRNWLTTVLPSTDLFLPSLDEILLLLDPKLFKQLSAQATGENLAKLVDPRLLRRVASQLCELGATIVAIKLGDQGLYLHTERDVADLSRRCHWQSYNWQGWEDLSTICPCYHVETVGTTGAGDCTIAGLLMALLQGHGPVEALRSATAVGALCVQSADATSNIPSWDEVQRQAESLPHLPLRDLSIAPVSA